MAPTVVLQKRPDFLRVATGRRWHGQGMVVQYAPRIAGDGRVGIGYTASRKVGGAVVRNRSKRRLRALVRELMPKRSSGVDLAGVDLVLIARTSTATLPFEALRADLLSALAKVEASLS